jgi:hypothetical protein
MRRAYFVCLFLCLTTTFLLSQSNPVPLVNQPLVPDTAVPGGSGFTLTVNGTQFVSSSVINWNGTALATNFVSGSQLTATVPASDIVTPNTASVTVSNPVPGGGTSNVVPFTITQPTTSVTFAPVMHSVGVTPAAGLVVADFNGDGKSDLAVFGGSAPSCGETSGAIAILLGNGHGGFTTKSTICSYGNLPFSGVVGDFNHDGKLDLAVVSANGSGICGDGGCAAITIYLGNGDGTFTEHENFGIDGDFFTIVAADFNRDGNLDLAVSYVYFGLPNVAVFLGNGDGSFNAYSSDPSNGYLDSSSLAVGDFNNDGIIDLVSVGSGGITGEGDYVGPVSIWLGNGDGTFTLAASQPDVTLVEPDSVIAGDFTGDGNLDLAIVDPSSTALTILKGNGDGTFTQVSGEPSLPQSSNLVGMADFNGDGKVDLAYSTAPNIITLFLGNGDGTFQAGLSETVDNGQFGGGGVGDFNGDGRLDLAIANSSDTFFILRQKVPPPSVSVTLASGQDPSYVNQPVTYTAVVSASPYSPTGSVTFKQGATILGTVPLVDGQASFTTTFTKAGSFSIVASYSGDQNYRAKNSNQVEQIVNKYTTATYLSSSPNPSAHGQPVTFTAAVSSAGPLPTGKVAFKNGSASLGSGDLVSGVVTLTKSNLPLGSLSITATYEGDAESEESTTPALVQVVN